MVMVAEIGDKAPAWYKSKDHLGYTYGASFLIAIEPADTAACWMHCDSCIVGMMFSCSVLQQLTQFHTAGKESICETIFDSLKKCNLKVPKLKAISTTIGVYHSSLSTFKCTGRATKVLCLIHKKILDLVFPVDLKLRDPEALRRFESFSAMWANYIDNIVPLINNKGASMTLDARADLLQIRAKEFMRLYVSAHRETAHLYPHIMLKHMPVHLKKFRVDLFELQLQSVEHTNKDVKTKQANCSNRKQSHHQEEEVSSFERTSKLGKVHTVKKHTRDSGPCRTAQVHNQKVLTHATDDNTRNRESESQSRLNSAKKMKFEIDVMKKLEGEFNSF
jgi:hypothetical protein